MRRGVVSPRAAGGLQQGRGLSSAAYFRGFELLPEMPRELLRVQRDTWATLGKICVIFEFSE
jgi:hypothetical protein